MSNSMAFWFRRKYNLPPTDPRFLNMTALDFRAEWWAHYYADNGAEEEFEDEDFDLEEELRKIEEEAEAEEALTGHDPDDFEEINLDE